MATNNAVNNGLSGATGTASFVGSNQPTITTPTVSGYILGANGIESASAVKLLTFSYTASAVNYFTMLNNITGSPPTLITSGSDPTIQMQFQSNGGIFNFADNLTTTGAELRFFTGNGAQYTGLKKANAGATSVTLTLPDSDGSNGSFLQTNGAGVLSFSSATFPTSVSATGTILRSNGTNWVATTATYPTTTTINRIIFSSANNTISEIATANSGVLVTNSSGVPSIQVGQIPGTATNDNANAGNIGEFISSTILSGGAVSLTTATPANVTSISLTAGDWLAYGNVSFSSSGGAFTTTRGWISSTSATAPDAALYNRLDVSASTLGFNVPITRFSLSSTTTIYLSVFAGFPSTATVAGSIGARRVR